ncbi:MAG TPA: hypothetical protein VGH33_28460 [Isosphaeraceae bacterium]
MHKPEPLEIDDPADYIGVLYRIVRVDRGRRKVVAIALRGQEQARGRLLRVVGAFVLRQVEAAGGVVAPGDTFEIPADLEADVDAGTHLRIYLPDRPVDFLVEEDTCAGDPACEEARP